MSEYPYYSLEGIMEQYEPLGVQLSYLLLCLYAYEYVVTGGKGEPVENAFLVGCGIQCFIGYAQMLQYVQKPETWKGLYLTLYNPIKLSGAFTDDAYVRVSYNGQTRIYRADELNLTYAKNGTATGYVDVVLDVSDPDKTPGNAEIRVSTDNNNNVKTWTLNLSRLQREAEQRACGTVTEPSDVYGIRTSSPVIVEENDGTDVTVTYPSVS